MNTKHFWHRAGAFLLSGLLLCSAAGCGTSASASSETGGAPAGTPSAGFSTAPAAGSEAANAPAPAGMGRWAEEKIEPSGAAQMNYYCVPQLMDDDALLFYGDDGGAVSAFTSTDDGASWVKTETTWVDQMQTFPRVISLFHDGSCFIITYTDAPHYWLKTPGSDALTELTLPENLAYIGAVYFMDADTLLVCGHSREKPAYESPEASMDQDGTLLYPANALYDVHLQNKIAELDPDHLLLGSLLSGTAADGSDPANPLLNTLDYLDSGINLMAIDKTGKTETVFENVPAARDAAGGAATDSTGNYYYFSTQGIYRIAKGGSLAELLFDGSTFEMGVSGVYCAGLSRSENGSFFALLQNANGETSLYRYFWDETLPAESEETLTVWSLEENQTVRAAIVEFSKQQPEISVEYQAAMADTGITKTDAISALNAQLLAGSGPDVLILDGLDYRLYQQKGLLADYADSVDSGALLQNIVSPFLGADGSVTVLPARFGVPLVYGDDDSVAALTTLEALQNALLTCPARPAMDCADEAYYQARSETERYGMSFLSPADLLDFTLQTSAPAIWDGSALNAEAIRQTLSFVQSIGTYYAFKQDPQTNGTVTGATGSDDVVLYDGGYEFSFTDAAKYGRGLLETPAFLGETRREPGSTPTVILQPGLVEGAYLPTTLAGINASSQKQAQAKALLGVLFGETVQGLYQEDGCPVLQTALAASIARNQSTITAGGYTGDVQALIAALKTPVLPLDAQIYSALLDAANALAAGTTSLDEAVAEVQNALTLYLSEKQ